MGRGGLIVRMARQQRVVAHLVNGKNTGEFARKRAAHDIVNVQHRGMRGQAREDGRDGADLGPVHHMRQRIPIGFIAHVGGERFVAGDDQRIQPGHGHRVHIGIKAFHARQGRFAARNLGHGEKMQAHIIAPRRFLQEMSELQFGGPQRRIRHVVDQTHMQRAGAVTTMGAGAKCEFLDPARHHTARN